MVTTVRHDLHASFTSIHGGVHRHTQHRGLPGRRRFLQGLGAAGLTGLAGCQALDTGDEPDADESRLADPEADLAERVEALEAELEATQRDLAAAEAELEARSRALAATFGTDFSDPGDIGLDPGDNFIDGIFVAPGDDLVEALRSGAAREFLDALQDGIAIDPNEDFMTAVGEGLFVSPGDNLVKTLRSGADGEAAEFMGAFGEGLFASPIPAYSRPLRQGQSREFLTAAQDGHAAVGLTSDFEQAVRDAVRE